LAPLFLLGIGGGVLTGYLERTHVGASGAEWNYSVVERVLIAGRAVWFYAGKLVWPVDLAFMYGKWRIDSRAAWQWFFPTAAVVVVVMLFVLRKRIGRGPVVAVLFFVGTLAPALGFVNVYPMRYTFVADHYQYHASVGLIALLAAVLTTLYHRVGMGRRGLRGAPAACAVLLPLFVLTWRQASIYRDRQTLWSDTLAKVPDSWMAWIHLGNVAATRAPPDKATARAYWLKALKLNPNVADTHYNMGVAYADADDYSSAAAEFRRAIELEPHKADPRNMLGLSLAGLGRVDEGIAVYREAIAIEPYHWKSHFNLGIALEKKGELDAAVAQFSTASELNPRYAPALRELANCFIKTRRYTQAEGPLRRLVELRPDDADALFDLGTVLSLQQRFGEAQPFLLKAFSIKPELQGRLRGKG
jgi:Tfp pilus assembly protein PilF